MSDPRTLPHLSGQDLAALRRAAGLSQTNLAKAASLTRYTVSRWEQKAVIDVGQDTPRHLLEVLMTAGKSQFSGG